MQNCSTNIPSIENLNSISQSQLEDLASKGFCYVKLPEGANLQTLLDKVHKRGLKFFRKPEDFKKQWPVNENFAGYENRRDTSGKHFVQQAFFRPEKPIEPFKKVESEIAKLTNIFESEIAWPLLQALFDYLNVKEGSEHLQKMQQEFFHSFSFSYYPDVVQDPKPQDGLCPHKDFGLITILNITKPGLEVFMNDQWHAIDPKPGYIVINLANALEQMLDKQITSALHHVRVPKGERLSFGVFVDPSLEKQIVNLKSGEVIAESGMKYLEEQFKLTYEDPLAQSTSDAQATKLSSVKLG